jgi:hypothetical protein
MSGDGKRGAGHWPQATAPILDSTTAESWPERLGLTGRKADLAVVSESSPKVASGLMCGGPARALRRSCAAPPQFELNCLGCRRQSLRGRPLQRALKDGDIAPCRLYSGSRRTDHGEIDPEPSCYPNALVALSFVHWAPLTGFLRRNKPFHACDANWLGARAQRRTQGLPSV